MSTFRTIVIVSCCMQAFCLSGSGQFREDFSDQALIIDDLRTRVRAGAAVVLCEVERRYGRVNSRVLENWTGNNAPSAERTLQVLSGVYKYDLSKKPPIIGEARRFLCIGLISPRRHSLIPVVDGLIQHTTLDGLHGPRLQLSAYKTLVLDLNAEKH